MEIYHWRRKASVREAFKARLCTEVRADGFHYPSAQAKTPLQLRLLHRYFDVDCIVGRKEE